MHLLNSLVSAFRPKNPLLEATLPPVLRPLGEKKTSPIFKLISSHDDSEMLTSSSEHEHFFYQTSDKFCEPLASKKGKERFDQIKSAIKSGHYLKFFFNFEILKRQCLPAENLADILYHTIRYWGHPTALKALIQSGRMTEQVFFIAYHKAITPHNEHHATFDGETITDAVAETHVRHVIDRLRLPSNTTCWNEPQFAQWLYKASAMQHEASVLRLANDEVLDFSRDPTLRLMASHAAETGNKFFADLLKPESHLLEKP